MLTNSKQQTQSYKFTSHIAAFLSVVLFTETLEICIQTSYNQNVQLILKSYLPVVYGTPLIPPLCFIEMPVPSQESELLCIRDIYVVPFYDSSIGFWNKKVDI